MQTHGEKTEKGERECYFRRSQKAKVGNVITSFALAGRPIPYGRQNVIICRQFDYLLYKGEAMTPTSPIHPRSFLGHLCAHQPLITSAGNPLARLVPLYRRDGPAGSGIPTQAILVSIDNGNKEPYITSSAMIWRHWIWV